MRWIRKKKSKEFENNNRVSLVAAIIFISGAAAIGQLIHLQIIDYDFYRAAAARQQEANGVLPAMRGKIFIQDERGVGAGSEMFPIATNRSLATVFSRPAAVNEPQRAAESLYAIFDETKIAAEVEKSINEDESIKAEGADFKAVKLELELKSRKEKTIANYLSVFAKTGSSYVKLADRVEEETAKKIKGLKLNGIDYNLETQRFYPEKNIASHLTGFVGFVGHKQEGRYGLEGFFDKELAGKDGYVKADRNAMGELIVMNDADYTKAVDGRDLILTINRSLQFEACGKLKAAVEKHGATGGSVIIMEPSTGAIIALCAYPDYDPNYYREVSNIKIFNNPAIFSQYEPGSTFKSITMAAALDQGKVTPQSTYDDKGFVMVAGWPKPIKNSDFESFGGHGRTDMTTVLVNSLNTGAISAMEKIGAKTFADYVKKFGFGDKTGIELETEATGNIANLTVKNIRPVSAATASFGQGISVTALQMITAYAAIANGGTLMQPYIVKAIVGAGGERIPTAPKQVRQVITNRTSAILSAMLTNTVEKGHAKGAKVTGYYVAGKTGTAQVANEAQKGYSDQTIHSFIGFSPVNNPKFVMLTSLDDPKDAKFAESTAVPLFGEIAKFVLNYYQVPQERKD
jgi:cell division protein FtsI/penicillin-binding protein 2